MFLNMKQKSIFGPNQIIDCKGAITRNEIIESIANALVYFIVRSHCNQTLQLSRFPAHVLF